jgi:sensor histidine kinase regulating citrate/malate metabolism
MITNDSHLAALDCCAANIMLLNDALNITHINKSLKKLLTPDEVLIERSFAEVFSSDCKVPNQEVKVKVSWKGAPFGVTITSLDYDGSSSTRGFVATFKPLKGQSEFKKELLKLCRALERKRSF